MRKSLFHSLLLVAVAVLSAATFAADPLPEPVAPSEFKNVRIAEAIDSLAKLAKLKILVTDEVGRRGTFTMTLATLSPKDALEVVVRGNGLSMTEYRGIYYIMTAEERTKTLHSIDNELLPIAIAKLNKRYFDALIAEGFTREEALRLVAAHQIPDLQLKLNEP